MGIEPTNYPCDAGCATLNIQSVYSVSNQTNCIPLHYLSMSASSLPYVNTLKGFIRFKHSSVDAPYSYITFTQESSVFAYGAPYW